MSDDASENEVLVDLEQGSARRKRAAGGCAATALLLLGVVAISTSRGMPAAVGSKEMPQQKVDMVVRPPYDFCSKVSENCLSTKCCKVTGQKCFMLSSGYAQCKAECEPGKDGWCTELVHLRAVELNPGLRLFCFGFYMKDTGSTKKSYDLELFRTQLSLGASIFGCPKWQVYSDVDTWLSPGPPELRTKKVDDVDGDFHMFKRKKFGTWVNAMMFYQAWMDMRSNKLTQDSDWVVKADADAVFLPGRLLSVLEGYEVPGGGLYIENCEKVMYGFFGNLEVVSHDGFDAFLNNLEHCKSTLDWKGLSPKWKFGPWGEDLFMQKCMDIHGVAKVSNFSLTKDALCPADRPRELQKATWPTGVKWMPDCLHTHTVSMHPFMKPEEYFACLANTQKTWEWADKPWTH
jgi:hypothetical protein